MNEKQKTLIFDWRNAIKTAQVAHYECATSAERMNKRLGISVVTLSALAGTSVIGGLAENPEIWIKIPIGAMSVLAVVLSALQTFLNYAEQAEFHRISAVKFSALQKEIEQKAASPLSDENEIDTWISSFREKWDILTRESPTISKRIWESVRARIKKESSLS